MSFMKDNLERKLGLLPVTSIVIANMIGAGIFTTSGLLMQDLGNPVVMLILWIVGGVIALCGALSYGELGASIPKAGGEYNFLSELYHPVYGFLSGWLSLIAGFSAPIAASAIGFSEYFFYAFPQFLNLFGFSDLSILLLKRFLALTVILVFTVIHLRGLKFGTSIQNGLTLLKIFILAALIILGFAFGDGSWAHLLKGSTISFEVANWKTIGLSLMWIMFAYSGWNAATYIGSEIKDPKNNVPKSLLLGTGIVVIIYFLFNLFLIYAVDPTHMSGIISVGGLAVEKAFGPSYNSLVSIIIAFALFSSLSAFIIIGPRVYYAMAKDNLFFKTFAKVNPNYKVPSNAIILQGVIAGIMVFSGTFDQILTYMGFSLGIFPILTVFSVFKLRRENKSVIKMPGFPFATIFYLISGTLILFLAFLERTLESLLAIVTVLFGFLAYYWFDKRS